jgi:hypothetical protein
MKQFIQDIIGSIVVQQAELYAWRMAESEPRMKESQQLRNELLSLKASLPHLCQSRMIYVPRAYPSTAFHIPLGGRQC